MRLKLSLHRSSGASDDIVVTADAAASISDVAATIARLDPRAAGETSDTGRTLTLKATLPGQAEPLLLPPDAPLGEAWIGSGATVSIADAGTFYVSPHIANAPTVAILSVVGGPDAGREFPLKVGSIVLGREASCDIVLADPLVSKRHVRFEVSSAVEMVDLGSANGVVVDGGIVTRLRIEKEETLLIGDSEIRITLLEASGAAGIAPKAGPILFNRSPKVEKRYRGKEFASPTPPAEPNEPPFPLLAMIAPFLMGGAMFIFTKSPTSLLFVLMSPMMLIGNFLTNKRREKGRLRKAIGRFDSHLGALSEQLVDERAKETTLRTEESPSTQQAFDQAMHRGPLLWTRRPEHWSFLNVRLGVGTMASRNVVKGALSGEMLPEYRERLDALLDENRTVAGVPILDNLYESGALGIAGSPQFAAGSVNSVLVQVAALHSPAELVIAALVSPRWSRELEWLKWMPHTSSPQSPIETSHLADSAASGSQLLSAIEGLIQERLDGKESQRRGAMEQDRAAIERGADVGKESSNEGTKSPVPAVVIVISDDVAVDRARLVQLAEQAADAGVYPVWIADDVPGLPAVCRTYLALDGTSELATVGLVRLGETITDVQTETVDAASALDFARRMAPVIDAGALVADSSDLPRSISLVTLLGHDMIETSEAVIDRWRQNTSIHDRSGGPLVPKRAGKLRAVIGSAGIDAMHLDLRTQGPHALVGGTTGAGKSEFLQAWVLGMAAEYSPDRVTFLFVDYKGGSAFADCVNLPHTVGLVTDLSPHLVRRALTSLRAELRYREHLLSRKKAKDLLELEKRGDPESPPALVLVIDEFAALVGEVPEFVDGVVDIAQRGRSLGIHLIMATQRPAGVIKDNLRANTNLRIALRMADESDSQDVVGIKDAAHFDPSIPGRGVAKTGPGRLALFQSGYAGGWTSREPEIPDIEIAELRFGGENRWQDVAASDVEENRDLGPTDQKRLVASIANAAKIAGIPAPRRPWLDELAPVYDLGRLPQRTDSELMIGVSDIAEAQQQVPVYFTPDIDGNISIFGTGGSGKSTVLRTLAAAAAITPRGGPVQVYGLDFGSGGLRMLEALPHVGSIIPGDDTERIIRLFRQLKAEFERRGPLYAEAEASSIVEYRRIANSPGEPRILLLVDGFGSFREDFEIAAGRQAWYDVFRDILTAGRPLGMHVAFTADRAGAIPTSVSASVQRKVVLRLADDGYQMLDVPADILSAKSPAGRAIVDGYETQVAVLGGSGSVPDQAAATRALAAAMIRAGVAVVPPIGSLPVEFASDLLPASIGDEPVLGIGDSDLGPVGFEPSGTILVAGPPASGRTTALGGMAESMLRFDPSARLYYVGNARSSLAGARFWAGSATTADEAVQFAKDLTTAIVDPSTDARIVVIVETINDFLQSPADGPLVDLIKAIKRSDHLLIAEAETSAWNSSWPLFSEIKNARRGVLLQPEQIEGDILLKTPLPRLARAEFPPGRAIFIAKGKFSRVQLPLVRL